MRRGWAILRCVNRAHRRGPTRRWAVWAVSGVWCLGMVLLTAGLGDALSDDARAMAVLAGPGLAAIAVTLTVDRPQLPSWVLLAGPWSDRPAAARLLKPCLPGGLAAIAAAAGGVCRSGVVDAAFVSARSGT